jgi:hypothetical protein
MALTSPATTAAQADLRTSAFAEIVSDLLH